MQDVTGHVTGLALTSVNKFLAYNMIDDTKHNVTSAVENLADAVTHARYGSVSPTLAVLHVTLIPRIIGVIYTDR